MHHVYHFTRLIYILLFSCWTSQLLCYQITSSNKALDATTQEVLVTITLDPHEALYKDTFIPSTTHPADITLSTVKITPSAQRFFDKQHATTTEGYKESVTFTLRATKKPESSLTKTLLHLFFKTTDHTQAQEYTQELLFDDTTTAATSEPETSSTPALISMHTPQAYACNSLPCAPVEPSLSSGFVQKSITALTSFFKELKSKLSSIFKQTGSPLLRFLAALTIGLLLSLTPCIFPMIPITVGILQANKTNSTFGNFILALCYTLGISFTFAILGLVAAFGSCVFGELQGSPWAIIPLVAILAYLSFSMLGFYELYIPRFMQPDAGTIQGGSPVSAFTFGLISGLVASPCSSPGLILILTYVTSISASGGVLNYLEGFALLFVFGIGSSLPLLLIGTFSGAINLLPQAGMWMEEVKKLIGLMLLGMSFYYLFNLQQFIPAYLLSWLVTGVLSALGIYYFASVAPEDSLSMRFYKRALATLLIAIACFFAFQGYKQYIDRNIPTDIQHHIADYTAALETARAQQKNLLIDIGATNCSTCKTLDNQVFKNPALKSLFDRFIVLKVQADVNQKAYGQAKERFGKYIKGYPTVLLVNPQTEQVIKSWGGEAELHNLTESEIMQQFTQHT